MTLQIMPVDTSKLEFRYHGASEYFEYDRDTNKRNPDQARDTETGYPIYTVRCQVLFRDQRSAGMIAVRVPLPEPPADDLDFEHPITFHDVTARPWNMDGKDGQTWNAGAMKTLGRTGTTGSAPPMPSGDAKAKAA
jgi:hypothetical protein